MRVAIIENGIVTNVCEADQEWADANGGIVTDIAGPGWSYDGQSFVAPVISEPDTPVQDPIAALQQQVADLQSKVSAIQKLPNIAIALSAVPEIQLGAGAIIPGVGGGG